MPITFQGRKPYDKHVGSDDIFDYGVDEVSDDEEAQFGERRLERAALPHSQGGRVAPKLPPISRSALILVALVFVAAVVVGVLALPSYLKSDSTSDAQSGTGVRSGGSAIATAAEPRLRRPLL